MKKFLFCLLPLFIASCTTEPSIPQVSKSIESAVFWAPSSKVQLTVFADYECPSCIYFEKTVGEELFEKYVKTNKITATYKNFPLPQHLNAERDALAGLCALSQGKYWEFSKEMYALEDQKKGDTVTDTERIGLGTKAWVDTSVMTQCLAEGWYSAQIAREQKEGETMDLQGTPSVYLNGKIMKFNSKEEFFQIIDAVLKG